MRTPVRPPQALWGRGWQETSRLCCDGSSAFSEVTAVFLMSRHLNHTARASQVSVFS